MLAHANVRPKTANVRQDVLVLHSLGHILVLHNFAFIMKILCEVIANVCVTMLHLHAGSKAAHVLGKDPGHVSVPHVCGVMDWSCEVPWASTSQQA